MDHKRVIERIRAGHEEELEVIYSKYRTEFLTWLNRSYKCSLDDGKDIYQATLIAFFERIVSGKLVELTSSIKTYLFAIGKNKVQEFNRLARRDTLIDTVEENEFYYMPMESDVDEENCELVAKSLNELGDPCKSILQLYYYQKLSFTQIAEKLNYKNSDTSKNLKYKCLKRLRKIYESNVENSK